MAFKLSADGQAGDPVVTDVRAVFFDLDGTIVDSMPAHSRAWKQILGEVGIELSELYIELHEGEKAEETIFRLAEECGLKLSPEELWRLIEKKRGLYRTMAPRGLVPAARRIIEELAARGIECNIVTGSVRANINSVLPPEEVALFRHIITAEDYPHGKPAPDPYRMGLRQSGHAPEQCLVLENAPLGIRSARAAGLFTVAITTTLPPKYLHEANRIVHSYEEFLTILAFA